MAAIEWANNEDRDSLLFMLAICVSEVVRRWGVEAANDTLSSILDNPAVAEIGELVNAGFVIDQGGVPERFAAENIEAAVKAALEDEDGPGVVVLDMDTGEIL
jgi:hypothetical protein